MTNTDKAMETLMEQGRAHGRLTTTEINDVMEKLDLDVDQIDSFYDNCQSMNIDIIEDFDAEKELARLHKELENAEKDKEFIEKKLSNAGFVAKAPAAVVEQQRENLSKVLAKIELLGKSIAETEKLM